MPTLLDARRRTPFGGAGRTRLAVGLVSLAVIALELTMMRALSLRMWHHFAYMAVSVALLGFGASGTALTLIRRVVLRRPRAWLCALTLSFGLSVLLSHWAGRQVEINVEFLAWDPMGLAPAVLALEALMFLPFFLAGAMVGVALMDSPERISGHYAANLAGSGLGGVGCILLMYVLNTHGLFVAVAAVGLIAGLVLLPWQSRRGLALTLCFATVGAAAALAGITPREPPMSEFKTLPQLLNMPDTKVIGRREGPLGRIDVVEGPGIHYAPGLSLQYAGPVPPHVLLIGDGDDATAVYDPDSHEGWAFLDYTTAAAPYHLLQRPEVLIIGAGGGSDIALSRFHDSESTVALEMNRQVIELMTGPLADRGGDIYAAPRVQVVNLEARGYLAAARRTFDIIQLPPLGGFGASGAGLHAAQESYLYTVESFAQMLDRLSADGVLCATRWARTPPRDGVRLFDIAAQALRRKGLDPAERLAMIRCWATVTVLVSVTPFNDDMVERLRQFCEDRSFDLCYVSGMAPSEANRFHVLERPYYYEGALALLGPSREQYIEDYLFDVRAPTDDRPYFFRFFRWRSLPVLRKQLGGRTPAFLELGYLMLVAALAQAVVAAFVMILLPLVAGVRRLRRGAQVGGAWATFAYFLMLGMGFMLLEMGFLQRFILYLAHPIFSAAAIISSFMVFAGAGSMASGRWSRRGSDVAGPCAAGAVAVMAVLYLLFLDGWLSLTQSRPMPVRFALAVVTVGPLAFAMGHLFPAGLRRVGSAAPALVPWAWAVNGFASVAATVAAPLLAMHIGFWRLGLVAAGCYAAAGVLFRFLPRQTESERDQAT